MDARSGFCASTRTFRSLRPPMVLPPNDVPLSFPSFAFSRLPSPLPRHPAYLDASTGAALSYPELISRVRSLAAALRGVLGVRKGDVVLVLAPPSLHLPVVFLAVMSLGAVVSPVNPISTAADVTHAVSLCNPSFAFAAASTVGKLPRAGKLRVILVDSPRFQSFLDGHEAARQEAPPDEVWPSDDAMILYSSGTTGRTKAVAHQHGRLITSALNARAGPSRAQRGPATTLLGVPMFHSYGISTLMHGVTTGGTTVVVTAAWGGAAGVAEVAARCRVTHMVVAPPVVVAMARGSAGPEEFPELLRIDCGGAPLRALSAAAFQHKFAGIELSSGYGSTEGGLISNMVGPEECRRIKSTGRLCSSVEAKVVDIASGELLSTNKQGELCVRSPRVMRGYVGDTERNNSAFDSDRWLKTGDVCYFDEDGFLYIVDRLKEFIKYKAYQVAPAELEDVLQLVPGIYDAAVAPYPDEEAGQIPLALVVKQKGSDLTKDQVMEHVNKEVAPYKKIRRVVFVDSIPRSTSGKILRRELQQKLLMASKCTSRL